MTNISRFNFSSDKKITASKSDNTNNTIWLAFAKNSAGNCIIERGGKFKPTQTFFSLEREVDKVTSMDLNSSSLFVAYDDSDLLGEIISLSNPLTSTTDIEKGSYIESPVEILVNDSDVWFLLPGIISGENAKLLKYNTSGTFQLEIDLTKSGDTVFNASSMTVVSGGDIYIGTNEDPAKIVRVFEVSEDNWDFTVDETLA